MLWDMHEELMYIRRLHDWYFQEKWSALKQEFPYFVERQRILKIAPMNDFYILNMPKGMMRQYERILKKSKEMILKKTEYFIYN